jgi:GlpG protein
MRRLDSFEDASLAYGLAQLLKQDNIDATVEDDPEGQAVVWVMEEDDYFRARIIRERFRAEPQRVTPNAWQRTIDDAPEPKAAPIIDVRTQVWGRTEASHQQLTIGLVLLCCGVFLAREYQFGQAWLPYFYYGQPGSPLFAEVAGGQIWRIITPILLHMGWMHLIFNMLWLVQLGSVIETKGGWRHLLLFIVIAAALSNTFQYVITGPLFGGMSGVVYGLLGYTWGMGKWHPSSGYELDRGTFGFMMVWLVLCFVGLFGPVANYAHLGGLVTGVAWAYFGWSGPSKA